jgi:hypothetical protein
VIFEPWSSVLDQFPLNGQQQIWTSAVGRVARTNYYNSEVMSGIIAPVGASSITLQFYAFQTEQNYDFVTIQGCAAIDCLQRSVLGQYSGWTIPSPVTSNTGIMLIQWMSDGSVTGPGWSAMWTSVLEGGVLLA